MLHVWMSCFESSTDQVINDEASPLGLLFEDNYDDIWFLLLNDDMDDMHSIEAALFMKEGN